MAKRKIADILHNQCVGFDDKKQRYFVSFCEQKDGKYLRRKVYLTDADLEKEVEEGCRNEPLDSKGCNRIGMAYYYPEYERMPPIKRVKEDEERIYHSILIRLLADNLTLDGDIHVWHGTDEDGVFRTHGECVVKESWQRI